MDIFYHVARALKLANLRLIRLELKNGELSPFGPKFPVEFVQVFKKKNWAGLLPTYRLVILNPKLTVVNHPRLGFSRKVDSYVIHFVSHSSYNTF